MCFEIYKTMIHTLSFRELEDIISKCMLRLISDIEKCQFIESTIRGGIPMNYKGYAEAKNKFLKP